VASNAGSAKAAPWIMTRCMNDMIDLLSVGMHRPARIRRRNPGRQGSVPTQVSPRFAKTRNPRWLQNIVMGA